MRKQIMRFKNKKIHTEQTLGAIFHQTRTILNISLKEAGHKLHIAPFYLQALEQSEYDKFPGDVYMEVFVRAYADFLDLDPPVMLGHLKRERNIFRNIERGLQKDVRAPIKKASRMHFIVTPRIVKGFFVAFIAVLCLSYLGIKVEAIVKPPKLIVSNPSENLLLEHATLLVSGRTEPEVFLRINEQKIILDDEGNFVERLDLHEGLNVITISAKRDYGMENVIERRVVVEEKRSAP